MSVSARASENESGGVDPEMERRARIRKDAEMLARLAGDERAIKTGNLGQTKFAPFSGAGHAGASVVKGEARATRPGAVLARGGGVVVGGAGGAVPKSEDAVRAARAAYFESMRAKQRAEE
jgi:hypothetical protein